MLPLMERELHLQPEARRRRIGGGGAKLDRHNPDERGPGDWALRRPQSPQRPGEAGS